LRNWLYGRQEFLFGAFRTGSRRNKLVTFMAKKHLAKQVSNPAVRAKLTPTYTLGCKRLLVSDDYLPCFNQPNVELVTSTITSFTPQGIRTADGQERPFDAVVFATGFDVRNCLSPVNISGRGHASLQETWADGPFAYRGVAVPGFPNLFLLYGPNTNLGHNSIIFMLECQFDYIRQCVERIAAEGLASLEVREDACRTYNDTLHAQLGATVWATGCGNWYGQDGKITANWSGSSTAYWRQMRAPVIEDFAGVE
jgi:cation diffusion facilitator CzcD-associated flavoprotein CzcO